MLLIFTSTHTAHLSVALLPHNYQPDGMVSFIASDVMCLHTVWMIVKPL